jgi:hypothetical protein
MTQHEHDEQPNIDGDDLGLADDLDLKDAEEADAVKGGVAAIALVKDPVALNPQPLPPIQGPEKASL